jgi:DNA polymerase-3 subunit delta
MDALAFLDKTTKSKRQPIYALHGDEDFLKRRVRDAIVANAIGDADPAFALSVYAGDKVDFSTVQNDLNTLPFLSPCRVVVVEPADKFVTEHRATLEKYAASPSAAGVLVLDVKSFPETTKLAKALPDAAKITCKAPYANKLPGWCVDWARNRHNKKLANDAAELLVDMVGPAMGLLDQEIEKLTIAIGDKPAITAEDVDKLVGRSRSADVFRILDAVGEGKPALALNVLGELFEAGEDPLAVLGPMTFQLRKLAAAGRQLAIGQSLGPAMDAAGVPNFPRARQSFEKQLRHLGLRRLEKILDWLVEINLGVKGGNALPAKLQVERLVVKLARPREAAR